MEILLRNAQRKIPVDTRRLKRQAAEILQLLDRPESELSILLTNDAKIRDLNYNYRKKDQPTDVLSFPQDAGVVNESGLEILGDVVISVETARRQAEDHGLSLEQELVLLLTHGILHLMGLDHERSAQEARLTQRRTKKVLTTLYPGLRTAGNRF